MADVRTFSFFIDQVTETERIVGQAELSLETDRRRLCEMCKILQLTLNITDVQIAEISGSLKGIEICV